MDTADRPRLPPVAHPLWPRGVVEWLDPAGDLDEPVARVLLGGILAVAALLRVYRLTTWQHFRGDEGRALFAADQIIAHGRLPLLGPPLVGFPVHLGPFFYYLIAPALWLAHGQPTGPAVLIALVGVATVALLYWCGRACLESRLAGLVAAAGAATSQVLVYHSRYVWNPNLAPFFATAVLACLCAVAQGRQRALPWLGLSLSLALQVEPSLVLTLPVVALVWLIARPLVTRLAVATLGVALFLVAQLPLLLSDLRTHGATARGWVATLRLLGGAPPATTGGPGGALARLPLLHDAAHGLKWLEIFWARLLGLDRAVLALPLLVLALGIAAWTAVRTPRQPCGLLATVLLVWVAVYTVALSLYQRELFEQYALGLAPGAFLLLGLAAERLWRARWRRVGRLGVLGVVLLLALSNSAGLWQTRFGLRPFQRDTAEYQGVQAAGMTLADMQQVVDSIATTTDHQSFNLVLVATDDYDAGYRYLLSLKGLMPAQPRPATGPALHSLDPAVRYPGSARNVFLIIQPRWWPQRSWPAWIARLSAAPATLRHPDQAFASVLVRYLEQTWAPRAVAARYATPPCAHDEPMPSC